MSATATIDRKHMSARERHMLDIAADVRDRIAGDCDVSEYAWDVSGSISDLLAACDVRKVRKSDRYTMTLVQEYVTFVTGDEIGVGGSNIDYCSMHCLDALAGYRIRLRDGKRADEIKESMRRSIMDNALYPQRELDSLSGAGIEL